MLVTGRFRSRFGKFEEKTWNVRTQDQAYERPKADKTERKDNRNPIAILVIYQIQRDIYFLFEYIYYLFTLDWARLIRQKFI